MKVILKKTRPGRILLIFLMMNFIFITNVRAAEIVRVGGAGSGLGVMHTLAAEFEKLHPETKIKILPNLGSSGGIKALLHGALDVAVSGRALKPEEQKDGAAGVECAQTPFIFIANKNVSKTDITSRELEMVYKNQLKNWPDGTRLRLVLRPAGDTDTAIVKNISKAMEKAVVAAGKNPDMIMAVTDQEAADTVAKTPGAFGGSTLTQFETETPKVKILSFNGIKPTLDTLAKGSYPLTKPLYLVTAPNATFTALQFVRFVQSTRGQAILVKYGSLPTPANKKIK